jgi:hypothetical protein
MSQDNELLQWSQQVSTHMAHLSRPQAVVLALWSYGIAMTRCCGITTVAAFLCLLRGEGFGSVRQRLREWCYAAEDKRGVKRQAVDVPTCFAPLLRWILSQWSGNIPRLALALDATHLRQDFIVLALCVVYNGGSLPIAWKIVSSPEKGSWKPYWEQLLARVQPAVPTHWQVIVLADSGLYAKWLYQNIVAYGWHPYLRLSGYGFFRPLASPRWRPLSNACRQGGSVRRWQAVCFKTGKTQLRCTLLAWWHAKQDAPWLIVTDLTPQQAQVAWYGLRAGIETGFKYTKRGGWHWEQTKMKDPLRAERLWLAMAVATLMIVSLETVQPSIPFPTLPASLSPFRRGWLRHLVLHLIGAPLPTGRFIPHLWPDDLPFILQP